MVVSPHSRSKRSRARWRRRSRRALSLLELVLALAISVVVIGLLTMAINFQMRTFERRRDRIEEAALARAILRNISDDLRSAVAYRPVDLQGLDTVSGNAAESAGLPTDPLGGAGTDPSANNGQSGTDPMANPMGAGSSPTGAGTTGTPGGESTDPMMASDAAGIANPGAGAYVAGLYGDQYSIQFDMSRLPRLDEYQSIVLDNGQMAITQIPTDIRTISYYLAGSTPMTQAAAMQARATGMATAMPLSAQSAMLPPVGQGLVRKEQDRSVASYSTLAVDLSDMSQDTGEDLLAEEVTRLEFRYFDGYQWWPSWDSDVRGGLPMAIEILVGLVNGKPTTNQPATTVAAMPNPLDTTQELIYRLVVRIPTGEPLDPAEAGMMMEEEAAADAAATSGSTSTSSASGIGAGGAP